MVLVWWAYVLIAVALFSICLLLNYVVNKINEVKLNERLLMLQLQNPAGQVTQVPVPLSMAREMGPPLENVQKPAVQDVEKQDAENVEANPMFLGTIYSKKQISMQRVPSDSSTLATNEVNDVLYRAEANIDDTQSPTVGTVRDETSENRTVDEKPEIQNAEIQDK